MAASSSSLLLLHKPTYNFHFAASSVPTYINSARFRISSSIFPLDRRRRRRIWSVSGFKSMADLVKTNARRDGEDRFQALEQEAFISNSSSELQNELVSDAGDGIEAIANRLVGIRIPWCTQPVWCNAYLLRNTKQTFFFCCCIFVKWQSKWIVAALFGSVLLLRHDGAALWAVIGSVSNSVLSVALKRILNQERPVATLRSDPGMPSSHAQSISFISVFSVFSGKQSVTMLICFFPCIWSTLKDDFITLISTVMEWLGTNVLSLFLSGFILALGSYFVSLHIILGHESS